MQSWQYFLLLHKVWLRLVSNHEITVLMNCFNTDLMVIIFNCEFWNGVLALHDDLFRILFLQQMALNKAIANLV